MKECQKHLHLSEILRTYDDKEDDYVYDINNT